MILATPYRVIHLSMMERATVYVEIFFIVITSGYRVNPSTTVNKYVYSCDGGIGPTKST